MGRGKERRKSKQKWSRSKKLKAGKIIRFSLANSPRKYGGFKNKYNYQTNIHNLIYKDAIFENVKYKTSNITECNFKNTKLTGVDFFHVNLRGSNFENATFEDVVFFNCNLKEVNFKNVTYKNVIFICTNINQISNFNANCNGITIMRTYPKLDIDTSLQNVLNELTQYEEIYKYHVLHVKKDKINLWSIKILLDNYNYDLTRTLTALRRRKNKFAFYTIYSYKKFIEQHLKI